MSPTCSPLSRPGRARTDHKRTEQSFIHPGTNKVQHGGLHIFLKEKFLDMETDGRQSKQTDRIYFLNGPY